MLKIRLHMLFIVVLSILFTGLVSTAFGAEYVGDKKCKMCHMKQYKS
jgi:hypothetical protein